MIGYWGLVSGIWDKDWRMVHGYLDQGLELRFGLGIGEWDYGWDWGFESQDLKLGLRIGNRNWD